MVALYGNDVNAAVGAVLQQMTEMNMSVEDAVAQIMKRDGGVTGQQSEESDKGGFRVRVIDNNLDSKLLTRATELRRSFTGKLKSKGNFGYLEVNIEGLARKEFYAHSKIKSYDQISDKQFEDQIKDISRKYSEQESIFKPLRVNGKNVIDNGPNGWLRNVDTEAKMLEDIARKLGSNRSVKGTIKLFTELKPCPSCCSVIKQFNLMFPNIVVEVVHNNGVRLK